MALKSRWHKIDGWRGYPIPGAAVAGSSDTGMASDSPAPSDKVAKEIRRFQRECLRPAGIKSKTRWGTSSNCFMAKRWVCVSPKDLSEAQRLAAEWYAENKRSTSYIHLPGV